MRLLLISLVLFFALLHADEIERIESIVNDITSLKKEYTNVQNSLVNMEVRLEEEKVKNKRLSLKEEKYQKKITSLENEIKKIRKSPKPKQNKQKTCKKQEIKIIKNIIRIEKPLITQTTQESNKFPNLLMKEEYKGSEFDTHAYSYRVKKEAAIYDAMDGAKVDVWEEQTSFTSNVKTSKWIKITGYFVDKVWQPTTKEMWIKSSDALKRDK